MKKCPKCGNETFYVTAHVTQDWKVDKDGEFMEVIEDCVDVMHFPDDWDMWTCTNCGHEAAGDKFEFDEEEE